VWIAGLDGTAAGEEEVSFRRCRPRPPLWTGRTRGACPLVFSISFFSLLSFSVSAGSLGLVVVGASRCSTLTLEGSKLVLVFHIFTFLFSCFIHPAAESVFFFEFAVIKLVTFEDCFA
jgi:hypothetical protein